MSSLASSVPRYPIRAVARITGLSIDTLRAWERRYEAVVPGRTERGRLYSEADLVRLRHLADLVRGGHAIGRIARLPQPELAQLLAAPDVAPPASAHTLTVDFDSLIRPLERYDVDALDAALNRFATVLPPRTLVFAIVVPLLREVGRRWEEGALRPAQEHVVSAAVRSVLGGLLRTIMRPQAAPRIAFATPAGERHELGVLCAALLAASAGYGVVYLGPDLPAADIAHAATTTGARIVVVGATMPGAVTRGEIRRLTSPPPGVELWVGGAQSEVLLAAAGDRARHVPDLTALEPLLSRHAR